MSDSTAGFRRAQALIALRQARRASQAFIDLWTLARLAAMPRAFDRVARDLLAHATPLPADHDPRDWPDLYRGAVLDD